MSTPSVVSVEPAARNRSRRIALLGFLLLSFLYFADTLLRTTLKTFWFDELVTVYLCRLPSFHATWTAVMHGTDFNPPLFYLMTRAAQHLGGGEGLIASRLPAIVGFWIFGVCLYLFTAPRLGRLCGAIAALAPWFTLAHYYAYEARAHGPLLAWCGLMLVCWQRSRRGPDVDATAPGTRPRYGWLLALALAFLGALLTHVYSVYLAVPFLLVELDSLIRRRRLAISTILALMVPPLLVAPLYLRMAHGYKTAISSGGIHIHPYEVVQHYLVEVFGPALILLLVVTALLAFAFQQQTGTRSAAASRDKQASFSREELLLALGLLVLPLLGVVSAKLTHGPYFDRYFVDSTAGFALLLAQVTAWLGRHSALPRMLGPGALLSTMLLFVTADVLIALYCHWRHADIDLIEPSSRLHFSHDPAQPLARRKSLLEDTNAPDTAALDILVTGHPDYLFLQYYAPPQVRSRLIFAAPGASEQFLIGDRAFSHFAHMAQSSTTLDEYFPGHRDFLLYETTGGDCPECDTAILRAGYTLLSVDADSDGRLEHFRR